MNIELIEKGLLASVYGLGGVFTVLILFYFITKIMMKVFSKGNKTN